MGCYFGVGKDVVGLLQVLQGFIELAPSIVQPTQAVEDSRFVGLQFNGSLDECLGFIESAVLVGQYIAQSI